MERVPTVAGTTNLIDILDRILDKGLVIAGDIRVSLANVELLTVRIRLLICSVDKAEQIGMNWWKFDPNLTRQVTEKRTRTLSASTQSRSVASMLGGKPRRSATPSLTRPKPRSRKK